MKISTYFTIDELTVTQVRGIDNTPPPEVVDALKDLAHRLDDVRTFLHNPVIVTSGYRCPRLNEIVGGSPNSAHMAGHAADFICPGYGPPLYAARVLVQSGIKFDQLILEYGWVHMSFDPKMRGQVLTKRSASTDYEKGIVA
jgi:putative chitinase